MSPLIELEKEHNYTYYISTCWMCEDMLVQPTFDKEYCHSEANKHNREKHGGYKFATVQGFNHYPGARDLGLI